MLQFILLKIYLDRKTFCDCLQICGTILACGSFTKKNQSDRDSEKIDIGLTPSGPQGFYQSKSCHFPKCYYPWDTEQLVVVPMSIRLVVFRYFW